ncbi:uncharacterized protein DUF1493 [Gibbsiella quercinecans]|uniref:Acyl carrier protein n=1 Tax=Gibbsiella quercinecans TaxID=929813 RepID=A0A250B3E4_9GAMM|nr:DUF1493 family protein [Gibbsiella quercinecans]ATA20773.1 acyl carrier protein [Gibbsiella quercinecans]RLM08756.1 acyl carrier protein [Gibbsiella quercinecans]RLM10401.1 acyl carrier protein [Gibbsiella quercinecans]TCT85946.1 uncharacterized protein DUF1493 [Gibbsiella quercinecans]
MAIDNIEQRIFELVRKHDGIYLFKKPTLTHETDLDSDLNLEDDEALALMEEFFSTFSVDKGNFSIKTYYPPDPPLSVVLNPFKKTEPVPVPVPDFTIGMLIESAKAGRWLYD